MLYIVGLGLYDEKDITVRGLEAIRESDEVYAEFYTNKFWGNPKKLEKLAGKKIMVLSRGDLEEQPEKNVLKNAKTKKICLLVSGDPMVATTHIDLVLRAEKKKIPVKIIHSSSVYSAVGETGLQIYKFGKTTTVAFPEKGYRPTSPYDVIRENKERGLHTLVLLDVKAEQSRYMTVGEAIGELLEMEEEKKQGAFTEETLCVGVARLGGDMQILAGAAKKLLEHDFGLPPHIIIIPGILHYMEEEALSRFA